MPVRIRFIKPKETELSHTEPGGETDERTAQKGAKEGILHPQSYFSEKKAEKNKSLSHRSSYPEAARAPFWDVRASGSTSAWPTDRTKA